MDNLCKTWKTTGISYSYKVGGNGATSTGHYPLTGAVVGQKDVYVETDSMTGFNPNAASLTDVQTAFTNNGVNLFITNDEQNLAAVPSLNVWSDADTSFTNDFDSIKAYHFGTVAERPVLSGTQHSAISSGVGLVSQHLQVSGITITTPSDANTGGVTEGTLYVKVKLPMASTTTLTVTSVTNPVAASNTLILGTPTATPASKGSGASAYKLLTIAVPFDTTGVVAGASFGTIDVAFNLSVATNITPSDIVPLTPVVKTTKLLAKAQAYRYVLYVNGIGVNGPSGMSSSAPGNKAIIALGASVFGGVPTEQQQAGTFMHELGHLLGLGHGGSVANADSTINCKPNYLSVMSYSRQLPTYLGNNWSPDYSHGTLLPLQENALTDLAGTPVTSGATQPWIVWGTPGGTVLSATTGSKLFSKQQTAKIPPYPNIDWKGDGSIVAAVAAPISGFGITGCSEITAQTSAYNDHNDWADLNFNFQTGAGASAFTGAGGDPSAAALYTSSDDLVNVPFHSDYNGLILNTQIQQSAEYPGLIPPPSSDGSTVKKGGSNLPLKFQYFVSGTQLTRIQGTTTTPTNFIGNIASIISTTACTSAGCGPATTGAGLIANQGSWSLNKANPSNEYYQFNWRLPVVTTNTKYYINIFVNSPSLTIPPSPLSSLFISKPLIDTTGNTVTMIITVTP